MHYAFGVEPKKPNPRLPRYSPVLSSRTFTVLHFTFMTVFDSESFFFFACGYPIVQESFVEKSILSPLYCLCSFVKDQLTVIVSLYFWVLYSVYWSTLFFCKYHAVFLLLLFVCFNIFYLLFKYSFLPFPPTPPYHPSPLHLPPLFPPLSLLLSMCSL